MRDIVLSPISRYKKRFFHEKASLSVVSVFVLTKKDDTISNIEAIPLNHSEKNVKISFIKPVKDTLIAFPLLSQKMSISARIFFIQGMNSDHRSLSIIVIVSFIFDTIPPKVFDWFSMRLKNLPHSQLIHLSASCTSLKPTFHSVTIA